MKPTTTKRIGEDHVTPFFTPRELAERWRCSIEKLKRMRRAGILPVHRIGRAARYARADVLKVEADAAV